MGLAMVTWNQFQLESTGTATAEVVLWGEEACGLSLLQHASLSLSVAPGRAKLTAS